MRRGALLTCILVLTLTVISFSSYLGKPLLIDESEGIIFDPLDDTTNLESYSNCIFENGSVGIYGGEKAFSYNFSDYADAWYREGVFSIFFAGKLLGLFSGPDIFLESGFGSDGYEKLRYKDNDSVTTTSSSTYLAPIHHFRFYIDQSSDVVSQIKFHWEGTSNSDKVRVFAWDYSANSAYGSWIYQGEVGNGTIAFGGDVGRFIGEHGAIDIVVVPKWKILEKSYISTDYVEITVVTSLKENAILVTKPVEPDSIWIWESIKWSSIEPEGTEIRCQILDEDGNPIDDYFLPGNEEGFTSSPVPLHNIRGYDKIKVKFILETNDPTRTPSLQDYTIMWQTTSRQWEDGNISSKYRTEKMDEKTIISDPIYLPRGYWWKEFRAYVNLNEGDSITFSILDDKGNVLIGNISGEENTVVDVSSICTRAIKLRADVNGGNPEIERWIVTFSPESRGPTFGDIDSLYANSEDVDKGYMNIRIGARDGDSGLCVTTAKYRLCYRINDTSFIKWSSWIKASCTGDNCTNEWETVEANDVPLFYTESLDDLIDLNGEKNITLHSVIFSIEDMAGNVVESSEVRISFDLAAPYSHILESVDDIGFKHGAGEVILTADADDYESGVAEVTLYYSTSKDNVSFSDPQEYMTLTERPWRWSFVADSSGYYRFFTIATDNAGNVEHKDDADLTLLIDIDDPEKPVFSEGIHWVRDDRTISGVTFRDDFEIYAIYYRVSGKEYFPWREIARNVDKATYSNSWQIEQWDWEQMEDGKEYAIYFKIVDLVGNEYITPNDGEALMVKKDTKEPIATIDRFHTWQWSIPLEISTYVRDDESGITNATLYYMYSEDNATWSDWMYYGSLSKSGEYVWKFYAPYGDGYYRFRLTVVDNAGNRVDSDEITVGLSVFPTTEVVSLFITMMTAVISIVAVVRKLKV
ncbi:MAG TPA: hypothetical protein ENG74_00280 [Thermoplasmatales archaeon]|nr:hypothetical protein [Thermoplasmatales archaeon]